jgi:DNA-binding CsgD family transcriptional regulator
MRASVEAGAMTLSNEDPISLVEAAYRVAPDQGAWLVGLARAASSADRGLGVTAWLGRVSPEAGLRVEATGAWGLDEELDRAMRAIANCSPTLMARGVQTKRTGTFSDVFGPKATATLAQPALKWGCRDVLSTTVVDPGGFVVGLSIPLSEQTKVSRREQQQWDRVGAHIAAGQRLLGRALELHAEDLVAGEAILRPDGHVEHASESAKTPSARVSLRAAALAMDRARSSLRRKDPDEALSIWRALVSGRWSLVDKFDSDGRRYLVAHKNDPRTRALAALTAREQQVTAYLALGHSNKSIAYELGISESTVSELGRRALGKLGISSRGDLVRIYSAE